MKSKLTKAEFKERLALRTCVSDFTIFNLLGFSGKPFRGIFDDSTFALVRNSGWKNARVIEITGEYKASDDNFTEVTYDVGISKKSLILSYVGGVIMLAGITAIYFFDGDSMNASGALALTGFVVLCFLLQFVSHRITKKLVDQRFREEFEIGQESEEEEWERLAGTTLR